jgi:nicotinamidase-related amidase
MILILKEKNKETRINMKEVLLLIDIQNDYFTGGLNPLNNPEAASKNAKTILENFRKRGLPVIHIRHISDRPGAKFFLPDSEGSEIHSDVKPVAGEKVVIKHFPNSFRETDLLDCLKSDKITDLVVCGMMTHMCVDSTVRAAKDYGFSIKLIRDACATKSLIIDDQTIKASDVHNAFISAMNYFYAEVFTANEFKDL